MYLFALIALGAAWYYAAAAWRKPRPVAIIAAILWLLYFGFEVLVAQAVICDEKCNIRVDLLLIWPILWVASFLASKTPGAWPLRSKVFGAISVGSLIVAVIMIGLVFLEDMDVFSPARRECRLGGVNAVQACDEALRQAPGNFTLYYHRALAHRAKGDHDRAVADMSKGIAESSSPYSKYSDAHTGRGVLHYEKGDIQRALADFDAAIKINQNDAVAYFRRGTALAETANLDRALSDFTRFIDLEAKNQADAANLLAPAKGGAFDSRGLVHLRLGSLDRAIADFDAALKLNPKLAGSLYGRGLAKIRKGDKSAGDADISAARAIRAGVIEDYAKVGLNQP